jgi:hypothetical protein
MVPCPNRLDSVEVHNKSLDSVTVIVFFDNHKESTEIEEEQIIAPGASFHFQEKSLDMGSWTVSAGMADWLAWRRGSPPGSGGGLT